MFAYPHDTQSVTPPPPPSSDSNRELVVSEGALPALIDILKSPSAEVLSLLALLVQNYKY